MLALEMAAFELSGQWTAPPLAGQYTKDVNGVQIAVGNTVKLVCTVTALTSSDPHFSGIMVTPVHPNRGTPQGQQPFANPQLNQTYALDPLQLIVGS